ncbi:MAG: ATP-binding protein [Waddliaceae bacterium]
MNVQRFTPMIDVKSSQPETKKRKKPSPEETQVAKRVHQAISPKLSPKISVSFPENKTSSGTAYDKKSFESSHESPAGSDEHRYFDLNVEKVLEDWEIYHALREVIANAIDEQKLTDTVPIRIFKDNRSHWHIRDFGRGLQYQHLTQNENQEKLEKENLTIGKFGVGLKDALATFDRNSIDFRIQSRHGDITITKTSKHNFKDLTTLHAKVLPPSDPSIVGTDFIFTNISDESVEKAKQLFLIFLKEQVIEKTIYGEVLLKNSCGYIYINGLKIAEEENFLFS